MRSVLGIVGLGVMGRSLALNLARKGRPVSVFSVRAEEIRDFERDPRTLGLPIAYPKTLPKFIGQIEKRRKVWIMVKAGAPTDALLERLFLGLERGDAVLEGGNSHFLETESRLARARAKGISYLGCGVSGGESGALEGPSLMAGGDREAWRAFGLLLKSAAASTELGPCAAFLGRGSAGHFIKMAHNGIEYGLMQCLADAYHALDQGLGLSQAEIAACFGDWNRGELASFLCEISVAVLNKNDDKGRPLLPSILDQSRQKGTGKWACQAALDLGVAAPTFSAAVESRFISGLKPQRARLGLQRPARAREAFGESLLVEDLEAWVRLAWRASFAQGLHLIRAASLERGYGIHMSEVLRVWSGGCIIRAAMLKPLRRLYLGRPSLENPLFDPTYFRGVAQSLPAALRASAALRRAGTTAPALNASLDYVLGISTPRLPANLIQAQRDLFGAHTYERIDKKGSFHTSW